MARGAEVLVALLAAAQLTGHCLTDAEPVAEESAGAAAPLSPQCLACQILVTTLHAEVTSRVNNPSSGRYGLDDAVATVLSEKFACLSEDARSSWRDLAGHLGQDAEKLLAFCKSNMAALEDVLDTTLQKQVPVHEARERVCLKGRGKRRPCPDRIWTLKEAPVPKLARQAEALQNRRKSEAFLKANAKRRGVVSWESGLQHKVIQEGTGPKPAVDARIQVHYRATLTDCKPQRGPVVCKGGTEFDTTYNGKPYIFSGALAGSFWKLMLPHMPIGSIWEVYVPHALAYGGLDDPSHSPPALVGPESALIFKVELIGFESDNHEDFLEEVVSSKGAEL